MWLHRSLPACRRVGLQAAAVMVSRRGAVTLLSAVVVVELAILGVGVSRRLAQTYDRAAELSRMQLAVIEAQELARSLPSRGSASIGAAPTVPPPQEDEGAPPLRPRDVEMIVAQEGGLANENGESGEAEKKEPSAAVETVSSTESQEDDLLDHLIRQGVAAMVAGDMKKCILSFEEAWNINPDHPALLYYYGMAYDKLLNPAKAREYYSRVFRMRDKAGTYFQRASHRLTYGFDHPADMRGKLAFGPCQVNHTYDETQGERVSMLLPVLLAPGEEVRPDDIYIRIQFFDLVNGRKIEFCRLDDPRVSWQKEPPDWSDWEENLQVTYAVPPLTKEEQAVYGDLKYYGYTAQMYYKGEPMDCISSPSALILHEQRLKNKQRAARSYGGGLLPDDGLDPVSEEAVPVSDFLEELP